MGFILYHLSTNQEVQQKLYEEASKLLPNMEDVVTKEILAAAEYLKAFIKECFRLNPISIGIGRIATQEFILSGYKIPIGVNTVILCHFPIIIQYNISQAVLVTNNQTTCRLSKYFDYPEKLIPERWLKGSQYYKSYHPFISIPFGEGARVCIAKRLAEQNIYMTTLKVGIILIF
jgi:ecdysteroid 22-hydroxylase